MRNVCYCHRTDLVPVRVAGADARRFLHAQTTQDIADLNDDETRLAAWLSAAGRVLALFDVVADGAGFQLVTQADNARWLVEQLSRFVLRADAELAVADDLAVCSLVGRGIGDVAGAEQPMPGAWRRDGCLWARIGVEIVNVTGGREDLERLCAGIPACGPDAAQLVEIAGGRPAVPAALRDRYVPQMLNLDGLGAVSFTKGCYPGQEIVARTRHLGRVKRRLARFSLGGGDRPMPGDDIVDDAGRVAGEVVRAAASGSGYDCLAVVSCDSATRSLMLERDGRPLERPAAAEDI